MLRGIPKSFAIAAIDFTLKSLWDVAQSAYFFKEQSAAEPAFTLVDSSDRAPTHYAKGYKEFRSRHCIGSVATIVFNRSGIFPNATPAPPLRVATSLLAGRLRMDACACAMLPALAVRRSTTAAAMSCNSGGPDRSSLAPRSIVYRWQQWAMRRSCAVTAQNGIQLQVQLMLHHNST